MTGTHSIVVTAFNHSAFIAQSIESILSQTVPDADIVIVDDGSTDESVKIAKQYTRFGVRVFEKDNGGPSSAINFGIDQTVGDNIFLISADDVLTKESLAPRLEALSHPEVDIVSSIPEYINGDGDKVCAAEYEAVFYNPGPISPLKVYERLLFSGNFICAPSVAFTKQCWIEVGRFNESLWQLQDYEYWLRATALGFNLRILDEPMVKYRLHDKNLSLSNDKRLQLELDDIVTYAPKFLSQQDLKQLLFGETFRNFDVGIGTEVMLQLVNLRSFRPNVRIAGQRQLNEFVNRPEPIGCF